MPTPKDTGSSEPRIKQLRVAAGLSQTELAVRAGISRQRLGAIETGKHLPRVDAALSIAAVLGEDVDALFATASRAVDIISGTTSRDGAAVRSTRLGDLIVTAPARIDTDGWDTADGVVRSGAVDRYESLSPGIVVAGCEPGLVVLERMLRQQGMGAITVAASTRASLEALASGRVHAAVVHGRDPATRPEHPTLDVVRIHLTTWQVGLAGPIDAKPAWFHKALAGQLPVVQREDGAGVQRAFLEAATTSNPIPGQRVATHLASARTAMLVGAAGVTIEPAAHATGATFHALEVHDAELWIDRRWMGERIVTEALHAVASRQFQQRLSGVGGYDLTHTGRQL